MVSMSGFFLGVPRPDTNREPNNMATNLHPEPARILGLGQRPVKPAAVPIVAVDEAAGKQAADWLEMRRAAGWQELEKHHAKR